MRAAVLIVLPAVHLTACSDHKVTINNADPEAWITSHEDGELVVEDEMITVQGIVSDVDDNPDELVVRWYADDEVACPKCETTARKQLAAFAAPSGGSSGGDACACYPTGGG